MLDALTQDDATAAAGLSAAFGWPHRVADWRVMLTLGQGVAWRDPACGLGGTAMWFPSGPAHATIGLVQVAPSLQGKGLGRRLMQAAMDQAGARSLALCATEAGAPLYARLGFAPAGHVTQHQGTPAGFAVVDGGPHAAASAVAVAVAAAAAAIASLDRAATGLDRMPMLDVLAQAGLCVAALREGAAVGYAIARPFGHGMQIGPLVAGDEITARGLIVALHQTGFLRLDVPKEAGGLRQWLTDAGMPSVGDGLLMRRGAWPAPPPAGPHRFGLASQATG